MIDNEAHGVPTVGNLFFLYTQREYFESIRILSNHYLSQYLEVDDHDPFWIHVDRRSDDETE